MDLDCDFGDARPQFPSPNVLKETELFRRVTNRHVRQGDMREYRRKLVGGLIIFICNRLYI